MTLQAFIIHINVRGFTFHLNIVHLVFKIDKKEFTFLATFYENKHSLVPLHYLAGDFLHCFLITSKVTRYNVNVCLGYKAHYVQYLCCQRRNVILMNI